jgi:hypothetical protein
MTPSLPPHPNAPIERRRRSPATETLGANCLMRRSIRLSRAGAAASQRIWRMKRSPKTGRQTIGGKGQGTIANTAVAETPYARGAALPHPPRFPASTVLGRLPAECVASAPPRRPTNLNDSRHGQQAGPLRSGALRGTNIPFLVSYRRVSRLLFRSQPAPPRRLRRSAASPQGRFLRAVCGFHRRSSGRMINIQSPFRVLVV